MPEVKLTLYIAGGTINSSRAQQNINRAIDRVEGPGPELTIIDLLQEPGRAVQDNVLVTPMLTCQYNNQKETYIGTLEGDVDTLAQRISLWLKSA